MHTRRELRTAERDYRNTYNRDALTRVNRPRTINAIPFLIRFAIALGIILGACSLARATDFLSIQRHGQTVEVWGVMEQMNIDGHNGGLMFTPTGATHIIRDRIMRDGNDNGRGQWTVILPDMEFAASCYAAITVLPPDSVYTLDCAD